MHDRWVIEDIFGRRWVLWLASHGEAGGATRDRARSAIDELVYFSLGSSQRRNGRAATTLLAIHDRLRGGMLARGDGSPVDLETARRTAEKVSEALGHAAYCGHLRVEREKPHHLPFVLDDAPASPRDAVAPSDVDLALTFIEIEVRDESDRPVPNARYIVVAPGEDRREGKTGPEGRAREGGLKPGTCSVSFPEIHGPEWSKG